jgi:hypothetical protein
MVAGTRREVLQVTASFPAVRGGRASVGFLPRLIFAGGIVCIQLLMPDQLRSSGLCRRHRAEAGREGARVFQH